ncbi:MAG: hypothetical protein Kow0022_12490 [Phycisphaerales bacterium]
MAREPTIAELVRRLGRVRASRIAPQWQAVVGGEIELIRKELAKRVRANAQLVEAWRELAPAELRDHAWPEGVARGTLRIVAEGPGFRYRVEQWLGEGGRQALLARCSSSVKRVRVELAGTGPGECRDSIRADGRP